MLLCDLGFVVGCYAAFVAHRFCTIVPRKKSNRERKSVGPNQQTVFQTAANQMMKQYSKMVLLIWKVRNTKQAKKNARDSVTHKIPEVLTAPSGA